MKLIGLLGHAESGKGLAGEILQTLEPNSFVIAFGDKIKQLTSELLHLTDEQVWGSQKEEDTQYDCDICPICKSMDVVIDGALGVCQNCTMIGESNIFASKWTSRKAQQSIGDCFRAIYKDVWVSYTENRMHRLANGHIDRHTGKRLGKNGLIIAADVRYYNECRCIWKLGGEVWRVVRPGSNGHVGLKDHSSETEMDKIPDSELQAIIQNDATPSIFRERVMSQYERFLETFNK